MNLFMLFAVSILGLANILETSSFAQCTEELFFCTLIFSVGFRHILHKVWICKSNKVVRQCIFNASLVTISYEPAWLKCEENEEARRLFFNPEEPRICIFRAREEPQ